MNIVDFKSKGDTQDTKIMIIDSHPVTLRFLSSAEGKETNNVLPQIHEMLIQSAFEKMAFQPNRTID